MTNMKFKTTTVMDVVSGFKTYCQARGKEFFVDMPSAMGGSDSGMNPVEVFMNSISACKCFWVKKAAMKMGIEVKEVRIECIASLSKDPELESSPVSGKGGISELEFRYHFDSTADKEELEKLVDFVERGCTVKNSVVTAPKFTSQIL